MATKTPMPSVEMSGPLRGESVREPSGGCCGSGQALLRTCTRNKCRLCTVLLCLLVPLLLVIWSAFDALENAALPRARSHPTLSVKPDGSFRLALFCDMHFGEAGNKDDHSVQFQHTMLKLESPDLVIIDGDASSNYASHYCPFKIGCHEFFHKNWLRFTAPFEQVGIPYAYTLGNHDRIPWHVLGPAHPGGPGFERDYAVTDHWIMQLDETYSAQSVTQDGPASIHGASNYVVPVLGLDGKPAFYIWLLDSSDNNCLGIQGWGCVYPDQVAWFKNKSRHLKEQDGRVVPGIMFHHIPLPELLDAWNTDTVEINGTAGEEVCCFSANTGLFSAIKEAGNIWGVFHGHDHNNDFITRYEGIVIGFGRKSGYGGYGGILADKPGSRIIDVQLAGDGSVSWSTRVRLESGEVPVQSPIPPERRLQQRECCGMAASWGTGTRDSATNLTLAIHACRTEDDANMCRIASGLEPFDAKPSNKFT
eukprot:TRINITY_DN52432_c0_g1_i1.p1 TRINITY_DN52432_c0_g1~~TRINITY_DN52432_c0_g1_i1.p1  ORF type:complete len:478 (-),score=52.00 TRINITY_DN52432_c0_g1_i1:81-1514(-)